MTTLDETSRSLAWVDWVVIAAYFVLCLGVGLFVSKTLENKGNNRRLEKKTRHKVLHMGFLVATLSILEI